MVFYYIQNVSTWFTNFNFEIFVYFESKSIFPTIFCRYIELKNKSNSNFPLCPFLVVKSTDSSYAFHSQRTNGNINTLSDGSTAYPIESSITSPYFETDVSNNVTALLGKSAYLSCRVRNLGNKTVSIMFFFFSLICMRNKIVYFEATMLIIVGWWNPHWMDSTIYGTIGYNRGVLCTHAQGYRGHTEITFRIMNSTFNLQLLGGQI